LTANDVQDLDRIIKQDLTKKYPIS
jgi:hypothetical protein